MLKRARRGFTLLELIVVLVVLGIIALIAIPTFTNIIRGSAQRTAETTAESIVRNANGIAGLAAEDVDMNDILTAAQESTANSNLQFYIAETSGDHASAAADAGNYEAGILWIRASTGGGTDNQRYACVRITDTDPDSNDKAVMIREGDSTCTKATGDTISDTANDGASDDFVDDTATLAL